LADGLGITFAEANKMLVDADYRWDSNKHTFVDKNGKDVKFDEYQSAKTSNDIKARYDFQHNYADKVWEKYGGNMERARIAYSLNAKFGEGLADYATSKEVADNLKGFAKEYNNAIKKFGNVGSNNTSNEVFEKIKAETGFQSNDNILYKLH